MSLIIPFSEACERNKDPILERLQPYLEQTTTALEIGTGTGQHVVHFAAAAPSVLWQPSDQAQYLSGIRAQLETRPNANILPPIELDVTVRPWLNDDRRFDLVYSANTLHIMPWASVEAFFAGLGDVLSPHAHVLVYGPFKFEGQHISASNAAFDQSLKSRGVGSAIRDFEAINKLAHDARLRPVAQHAMPANNHCLIWKPFASDS